MEGATENVHRFVTFFAPMTRIIGTPVKVVFYFKSRKGGKVTACYDIHQMSQDMYQISQDIKDTYQMTQTFVKSFL